MKINILQSGSSGNCYIIDDGQTKLMIEAGLPIKEIKKKGGVNIHELSACLISHEH